MYREEIYVARSLSAAPSVVPSLAGGRRGRYSHRYALLRAGAATAAAAGDNMLQCYRWFIVFCVRVNNCCNTQCKEPLQPCYESSFSTFTIFYSYQIKTSFAPAPPDPRSII